jgi:hypothetical protein
MISTPDPTPTRSNVIPLFDPMRMRERADPLTMLADAASAAALELRSRGGAPLAGPTNREQDGPAANVIELDPIANRFAKCEAVLCELRASIAAEEAR